MTEFSFQKRRIFQIVNSLTAKPTSMNPTDAVCFTASPTKKRSVQRVLGPRGGEPLKIVENQFMTPSEMFWEQLSLNRVMWKLNHWSEQTNRQKNKKTTDDFLSEFSTIQIYLY